MRQINLTAKPHGLNQTRLNALQEAKYGRLDMQELKGSTGGWGKDYEPNVRHQMAKHGLTLNDFRSRTNGSNSYIEDGVIFLNGVRTKYEVKTGDGIVGMIEPSEEPEFNEDDIMPGVDLVIYACEARLMETEDDILDDSIVLTREEFLTFIATEGPKRKKEVRTGVKFGTDDGYYRELNRRGGHWRDCICLQPTYREARQKACVSGNYLSLRAFLQENGRA